MSAILSKNIRRKDIDNATENYVSILQEFNITEIIKQFFENDERYVVIEYPGLIIENPKNSFNLVVNNQQGLEILENYSSYFSQEYDDKICVGILAFVEEHICKKKGKKKCKICEDAVAHYMAIVKTQREDGKIYIFDSASKNLTGEEEIVRFLTQQSQGSGYSIEPLQMTKEVQPAAGGSEDIVESQNIFCHTWCLWFLKELSCIGIEEMKNFLSMCGENISTEEYNLECLGNIKKFAVYLLLKGGLLPSEEDEDLAEKTLQGIRQGGKYKWLKYFNYIYTDDEEIKDISDYLILFRNNEECWYNSIQNIYGEIDDPEDLVPLAQMLGKKRKL
jgi:hypothetical protein